MSTAHKAILRYLRIGNRVPLDILPVGFCPAFWESGSVGHSLALGASMSSALTAVSSRRDGQRRAWEAV